MLRIEHLVGLADVYLRATGAKEVTVSFWAFNDSKKLASLRSGQADITVGRFNAAVEWFSANWPAGAEWPAAMARPVSEAAE